MGARSEAKAQTAIDEIKKELPNANIVFLSLDLSSFASVTAAANEIKGKEKTLDGLINNAGIMGVPFSKTLDGYEIQWQVRADTHVPLRRRSSYGSCCPAH